MTDIFLYSGEPNPNDVKLSDPTVLRSGAGTVFSYTGTGGISFGGAAVLKTTSVYVGAGGILFGGDGSSISAFTYASSGGITFDGAVSFVTVSAYAGSGGIAFDGVVDASLNSIYHYHAGQLVFTAIDSDLTDGQDWTLLANEDASLPNQPGFAYRQIGLLAIANGFSRSSYWYSRPGFPGLGTWPDPIALPFAFFVISTNTNFSLFLSIARVQDDGTVIDESPEVSLGSPTTAGSVKSGTVTYSFTGGSATDRIRIKIRSRANATIGTNILRYRWSDTVSFNPGFPNIGYGGQVSVAPFFGPSILFAGDATSELTTSIHTYAGDGGLLFGGVATTSYVPQTITEDSRSWPLLKRHAVVSFDSVFTEARTRMLPVAGDAAPLVYPSQAYAHTASVSIQATGTALVGLPSLASVAQVQTLAIQADAGVSVSFSRLESRTGLLGIEAGGSAGVVGSRSRVITGNMGVAIGPDRLRQDEEDLLMLLEVA